MLGAICGDILGSTVEFDEVKYNDISKIKLCLPTDDFTDDTALTLAVADWLLNDIDKYENEDDLKLSLAKQFVKYSLHTFKNDEGILSFGSGYMQWCHKADLIEEYAPYNSYGNGSGMRVSPVGWFLIQWKKQCVLQNFRPTLLTIIPKAKKALWRLRHQFILLALARQ